MSSVQIPPLELTRAQALQAHGALLAAAVLWGSSFAAMKVAVGAYGPLPVIWLRMVLAVVLFAVFFPKLRRTRPSRRDLGRIVLMALFEPCLYFLLEGYALQFTSSAQAGTVSATLPLMMAVAARLLLAESISKATVVGFVASLAGVGLLSFASRSGADAPDPVLGNLLEFLAMASAVGYMISLKKLSARYSSWYLTAMQAVVGSVFYLPLAVFILPGNLAAFSMEGTLAVLYLGTIITVGAYGLYNLGMAKLPAGRASGYINLIPAVAVLLGWAVLGERFTPLQCVGTGVVFAGVLVSQMGGRRA